MLLKKLWLKQYANRLFFGIYCILMPAGFALLGFSYSQVAATISTLGLLILCFQINIIFVKSKDLKIN